MKKKKFTPLFCSALLILAASAVIGLVLSVIFFRLNNNRTYVTSKLSFTFDGAQNGAAPNGYTFDINEVASAKVIEEALKNAGLSEKYTVEDILPCIEITGVYPEDMIDKMTKYNSVKDTSGNQALTLSSYHPTVFEISLYKDFDPSISKKDQTAILENILQSYTGIFAQDYVHGTLQGLTAEELEGYDYFQQLELLQTVIRQGSDYANQMGMAEPGFRLSGLSFSDLSLQFSDLISTDLTRLNAVMTMNALSRDLDRLKERYRFQIGEFEHQITVREDLTKNLDKLLTDYSKSGVIYLSTSDTLNKIDSQSSVSYDRLADVRTGVTDEISAIKKDISTYQNQLAEMEAAEGVKTSDSGTEVNASGRSETTRAEKEVQLQTGINRVVEKYNAAIDTLAEMITALNAEDVNDLTVRHSAIRFEKPKILSGKFIGTAIQTAGPVFALGLMAALLLIIVKKYKEYKQQ